MTRKKLFLIGIICTVIMGISGIYALTNTTTTKVENELSTGGINIQLKEYLLNNGVEQEYTENETRIMPGSEVALVPRISCLGDSCYIRTKVSYNSNGTNINLSDANLKGIGENWIKKGDYWYYKQPLETGAHVDFFNRVKIPNTISNENQEKTINVNVIAEAIQSKNFNVNLESETPWENVDIAKNNNETYQTDREQISNNVKVQYENGANDFIDIPEDFFAGLSELMPGDELTESVTLKPVPNNTTFYCSVKPKDENNAQIIELMKKLELEVKLNGNTTYEGNLNQLKNQSIGALPTGSEGTCVFKIKLPENANNQFAMLGTTLVWDFGTKTEIPDDYTNTYTIEIVKTGADGKTAITSDKAVFTVNGSDLETRNGVVQVSNNKEINSASQIDVFTISEKTAPSGYDKHTEEIKLNVAFKADESIKKFVIDKTKTTCESLGLPNNIFEVSSDNKKITVYVPNTKIPETKIEGKYSVELVKVKDDGKTVITSEETVFEVNGQEAKTKDGKYAIATNKNIAEVTQKDEYTIKEKTAPSGYMKYDGTIKLNVGFKKNAENTKYIIDDLKTSCSAQGLSKEVYKISEDKTKITVYVVNSVKTEGKYTVEIISTDSKTKEVVRTGESIYTINGINIETKDGKVILINDIETEDQKDTFDISQKTSPKGYNKFAGIINLKVGFIKDGNIYVIDKNKTTCTSKEQSKVEYVISPDKTKITVYVSNVEIPKVIPKEKSPQTGDVKIIISITVFIIAALCLVVVLVLERKSKNKEDNNNKNK